MITTFIQIFIVSAFVAFGILTTLHIVFMAMDEKKPEPINTEETFNLDKILHEIEEKEKAATRSNE